MVEWIPHALNIAKRAVGAPSTMTVAYRSRDLLGSSAANRLRKQMMVPAVVVNSNPRQLLMVDSRDVVKQYQTPSWSTRLLDLVDKDGDLVQRALIRKIWFHPVRETPLSVDFLAYKPSQEKAVKVDMPVEIVGVARNEALGMGYYPNLIHHTIPVYTTLDPIPPSLKIDIGDIGMRESVRLSDMWANGVFPPNTWPAVEGSSANPKFAADANIVDMAVLKIQRI